MNFEEELARGNFVVGTCPRCKAAVWPPSDTCSRCLGTVEWARCPNIGRLVGFSRDGNGYFCLAEFGVGIRVMGSLSSPSVPKVGRKVVLKEAGVRNGTCYFRMNAL